MGIIIETERLILRTWKGSDLTPMSVINQDPQVMEYFPATGDVKQTRDHIKRIQAHQNQYGYSLYAVELKKTGEMIGFVGLLTAVFKSHFTPATEIGWRLSAKHWNKGYATEAARAVLEHGFLQLDLNEIVSFTTVYNQLSRRVMEKIGLQHNPAEDFNHPKLDEKSPLLRHVLYRLTKEEYLKKVSLMQKKKPNANL